MQSFAVLFALCLLGAARAADDHPIEKVIKLIKTLKLTTIKEGQDEQVTYTKFSEWCRASLRDLNKGIEAGKENIDKLESEVAAKTQEEKSLTTQIADLETEIAKNTVSGTEAADARKKANDLYTAADADLEATVTAIGEAVTALEASKSSTSGLVQLPALQALAQMPLVHQQLTVEQRRMLEEPAVTKEDILKVGSQAKHEKKYSFKSGNVVELLKELKQMFEDQRLERTKAETSAANAFNLQKDARSAALLAAENAKTEKTTLLGETQSALNEAKTSLQSARNDLEADTESLKSTETTCSTRQTEWKERSTLREKEIQAMDAAVEILAKVSGVRTEVPENPVPPAAPVESGEAAPAFLQLARALDPKARALELLRAEASRTKSQAFQRFTEEVAVHLGRGDSPFDEVKGMIQKMIFRLMAEQTDEDNHKAWCDLEIAKTNTSKTNKEDKAASLAMKIEDAKASVEVMQNDITDAAEASAKLEAYIKEFTAIRAEGRKENAAAIKDSEDAQRALANAIAILNAHYKESGAVEKEAWDFLQQPVTLPEEPAVWGSSYTGVADPKNQPDGIISVLEQVASDMAQMEAETRAAEATDQMKFDEEMKKSKIEKARRDAEAEEKTAEMGRQQDKILSHEKALKGVNYELGAVEQYMKDLQPACVEGDSTYDARKQARADEVAALKEAQVILADAFEEKEAVSFLSPVRRVQK